MSDQRYKTDIVPGLVLLESNVEKIPHCPIVSASSLEEQPRYSHDYEFKMEYNVRDIEFRDRGYKDKIFEKVDDSSIYFERPVGFGRLVKMLVEFDQTQVRITVNRLYHEIGRITIDQLMSPGDHFMDLLNFLLLSNEHMLVHSAGFEYQGEGVLLIGLSNTGKTTTTLRFVNEFSSNYIAEDICVAGNGKIYSCPYSLSPINPNFTDSQRHEIYQKIHSIFPLIDHIYSGPIDSIEEVIGGGNIISEADLEHIFVLSNGDEATENIRPEQAEKLIFSSNRAEFTHSANQLLWAASYLGVIDLYDMDLKERNVLSDLVAGTDQEKVQGDPDFFTQVISEKLSK